jgi:hypothetical protein
MLSDMEQEYIPRKNRQSKNATNDVDTSVALALCVLQVLGATAVDGIGVVGNVNYNVK